MDGLDRFLRALADYGQVVPGIPNALGPFVVGATQQNITDCDSPPNAPLTKTLKGGKGPLKDTGETRASITYKVAGDTLLVGTNKAHAPLIHHGGTIRPKKAKKLAIPATREVKRWSETKGVKGLITMLEAKGWSINWRAKSVIGTPPKGAKGMGMKLKAKKGQARAYLLFIRKGQVKVPAREFMFLSASQRRELRQLAAEVIRQELF